MGSVLFSLIICMRPTLFSLLLYTGHELFVTSILKLHWPHITHKFCVVPYSFYLSSEELNSTDQLCKHTLQFSGFFQTLIFKINVTFQGKYFWKNNLSQRKICLLLRSFLLISVTFGVISGIKCLLISS